MPNLSDIIHVAEFKPQLFSKYSLYPLLPLFLLYVFLATKKDFWQQKLAPFKIIGIFNYYY